MKQITYHVLRQNRRNIWTVLALLVTTLPAWSQVQVTTMHNDNLRTGANMNETILNTTNVNQNTFGKLFSCAVDGLIFAQPLYMSGLTINGVQRNVVYVATAHDTVFAFDADTGARLWQTSLGTAVPSPSVINTPNIQVEVGIISTPVIDPSAGTLYVVAKTYVSGAQQFWLHALSLINGFDKMPAVQIAAQSTGIGYSTDTVSNGHVQFNAAKENQRPALTLVKTTNGTALYLTFASHEDADPYHGWVLAYDAATLAQVAAYNDTPNSGKGGIWMSGQGLVVDSSNNVYMMTGNSNTSTDAATDDFGESFLKLTLSGSTLAEADFFKPNNYASLDSADSDLGAGGPIGIPGTTLLAGVGKKALMYLMNTTNMGGLNATSDQVLQEFSIGGGMWGSPVFWNSTSNPMAYVWGSKAVLQAYPFNYASQRFTTTPAAASVTTANIDCTGALSISSNGPTANGSGIVWGSIPLSNPIHATVTGTLYAYSATPNGSALTQLWNSRSNAARDDFGNWAKYVPPTVANGKVYMATHSQQLVVYGLLSNPAIAPPTGLTATAGTAKITLGWTAPTGTIQFYNVYRSTKTGGETANPYKARVPSTSFIDSQVAVGVTYFYRVAAVGTAGASAQSAEASAAATAPPAATPTLASLSPSGVAVGSPDTTVTITGANLPATAVAHWTATATGASSVLATTFISASKVTAVIPAANLTAAGSGAITVSPGAAGTQTNSIVFTVGVPTVQVTGVTFSGGGGVNIQATITVTNKSAFQVAGAKLNTVTLVATNSRLPATGVPVTLSPSTLAGSGSGTATVTFPATSSLSLSSVRGIQFTGGYTGGSFTGSAVAGLAP